MRALSTLSVLTLAACVPTETLHVEVLDPGRVSVHRLDGALLLPPAGSDAVVAEGGPLGGELPTGGGSATEAAMTLERADGIHERWSTRVALAHGEIYHLVGADGVLPELPSDASVRVAPDGELELPIGHLFEPHVVRGGSSGYDLVFADPTRRYAALPILLRTPRDNLRLIERRVDKAYRQRAIVLWPAFVLGALGAGVVTLGHRQGWGPAADVLGSATIGGAAALDAFAIYALVTGGRRRAVAPPPER